MADSRVVAGTTVTQYRLERMFEELRAHHWLGIPTGYRPDIERFGPIGGHDTTACYEQVVHDMMAEGAMPRWFFDEFISKARLL